MTESRKIKRGDIFYYDFGDNAGSIQCGNRPVLVLQAETFNQNAPTTIVAAITTVIKKQYMASHIVLPDDTGLEQPSMVMLEQIRTVNKSDLGRYVGTLQDEQTWKCVNNGLKKAFGLWLFKPERTGEIRCLCSSCARDYMNSGSFIVKRLDPFAKEKDVCTKCSRMGYDYLIYDKRKSI
jgi:mRNA interferase MazF